MQKSDIFNANSINVNFKDTVCPELLETRNDSHKSMAEQGFILSGYGRTISYTNAKLAAQKGFDPMSLRIYYNPPKSTSLGNIVNGASDGRRYSFYTAMPKDGIERIHTTLLNVLSEWLAEKYDIDIAVTPVTHGVAKSYAAAIYKACIRVCSMPDYYDTVDEAIELTQRHVLTHMIL